ncbi:MAG TPA: O-methyltransferase [Phnomibacter sp.]|nr:O-methyltransferase [Phnomibacter sp.]
MPIDASEYADRYSSALNPLLREVLDYTITQHKHAHMVSGHTQGMFLQMLSRMLRPRRILEIGTFTGFSALCLAEGLQEDGLLYTLELREEDAQTAKGFFDKSEHAAKLQLLTGDARQIIPTLHETWDLVFIDADKVSYIDYYEMVVPALRPGGFILADNVLFHGEVLQDEVKGKNAKAIAAFNQHVQADARTQNVLLTVRDGLLLVEKTAQ